MAYVKAKSDNIPATLRKEGWKEVHAEVIWTKNGARLMRAISAPDELIAWPEDHAEVEALRAKGVVV